MNPHVCYGKAGPKQMSDALPLDPITHKVKLSVRWDLESGHRKTVIAQLCHLLSNLHIDNSCL